MINIDKESAGLEALPCPFCGCQININSCDRIIIFACEPCGYRRSFKGILQITKNDHPVSAQEFYHQDADEKTIQQWNKRSFTANLKIGVTDEH